MIKHLYCRMKKSILIVIGIIASMLAWAAPDISSVTMDFTDTTVIKGQPLKFTYHVTPADAEVASVSFESSDFDVMWVNNEGVASISKKGTTTIKVKVVDANTNMTHSSNCAVTVTYRDEGQCGAHLHYTIDYDYTLALYAGDTDTEENNTDDHSMYNYTAASPAPWSVYADKIKLLEMGWVRKKIGNNAFRGLTELSYVQLPDQVSINADSVFYGCKKLKTIASEWVNTVPTITATTLLIDKSTAKEVPVLIVTYFNKNLLDTYKADPNWSHAGRVIMLDQGTLPDNECVQWSLRKSDSLHALTLQIDRACYEKDTVYIQDFASVNQLPWYAVSEYVEELRIGDRIGYIGKNAFAAMTNLQMVQTNQYAVQLYSIHYDAFSHTATPWKFAIGDPMDGSKTPPQIVGMPESPATNFGTQTVLYVPDYTHIVGSKKVKTVTLYRNAPFWKDFNRITDRTVDTLVTPENTVKLKWLPLECADIYRLHIHQEGCATCDTVIDIPAGGLKGLINWDKINAEAVIPQYIAARRAPQDEGGGGLVLTISIKTGSGDAHNEDAEVQVAGMKPNVQYTFSREVIKKGVTDLGLTKNGSFSVPDKGEASGLEDVTVSGDGLAVSGCVIYDILGRTMGSDINALPDGIYILDNGAKRTTILLRR